MNAPPTLFISYSWETEEHVAWVQSLGATLRECGINVLLDQWEVEPGGDLAAFMERSVRDARFILAICTPSFATKANDGRGGVGYEKRVITGEMLADGSVDKVIPVLRGANKSASLPSYLKTYAYVDLRPDADTRKGIEEILRLVFGERRWKQPPIGTKPALVSTLPKPLLPRSAFPDAPAQLENTAKSATARMASPKEAPAAGTGGEKTLVLKGGGVKGLALVGAAKVLSRWYRFDCFVGTSAGAIVATLLAAGYTPDELETILWRTDFNKFLDRPRFLMPYRLLRYGAIHSGDPIEDWVHSLIRDKAHNVSDQPLLSELKHRAIVYATASGLGRVAFDSAGKIGSDATASIAVRYSMTIPFFFRAHAHDGRKMYDGGLRANFPARALLEAEQGHDWVSVYLQDAIVGPSRARRSIFLALLSIVLDQEDQKFVQQNAVRVVKVDTEPVGTTEFSLSDAKKTLLVARGELAALQFAHGAGVTNPPTGGEIAAAITKVTNAAEQVMREGVRGRSRIIHLMLGLVATALVAMVATSVIMPRTPVAFFAETGWASIPPLPVAPRTCEDSPIDLCVVATVRPPWWMSWRTTETRHIPLTRAVILFVRDENIDEQAARGVAANALRQQESSITVKKVAVGRDIVDEVAIVKRNGAPCAQADRSSLQRFSGVHVWRLPLTKCL